MLALVGPRHEMVCVAQHGFVAPPLAGEAAVEIVLEHATPEQHAAPVALNLHRRQKVNEHGAPVAAAA